MHLLITAFVLFFIPWFFCACLIAQHGGVRMESEPRQFEMMLIYAAAAALIAVACVGLLQVPWF